MGRLIVMNHVTLDGVMQAPARADEDTRDGFRHGGWAVARGDDSMVQKMGERMGEERVFLFGRRTYEDFYAVWAPQTDSPFTAAFANTPKYIASRTLREPLPWANSILLPGDAADAVAELKPQIDGSLVIFGSGELIRSLMAADLIDEYLLLIHPIVLGSGRRMFAPGREAQLELIEAVTTPKGLVLATYASVRPAATGG